MGILSRAAIALGWASLVVVAQVTSDEMGPAAFMWPPDREWTAAKDNTAPCGSPDGVGNRTEFPLTNGMIALVDQDEGYNIQVSVSYSNEPTSNADFTVLIPSNNFKELLRGHTCLPVADAPRSLVAGSNATLQIIYTADFDKPENQTFYACADITYVLASDFTTAIPCFNATQPSTDNPPSGGSGTSGGGASETSSPTAGPKSGSSKKGGLSGGAIAGVVVGSVVGAAILAGAALWLHRKRQQQKRIDAMTRSSRNVAWGDQGAHIKGKDSTSQNSVGLQNL
ncbi:hypothetical protein QBC33DRAFT_497509 [Phialemonium atrogriseum]|uniref:Copper acquisition factor BIM1-like domain-containing protein n=1 Tax=Phialemonium atrogriseum TaxID=1093897 RepID=A0AAJ0BTX8_9PEZI|nr:uncharacterized protein QBC33DRAFT_497509 [Phialemonium atrogriseum]KAK1764420.1 hypothetical protein QBC33DRAFT_497509 [Phialemonium atrogriseum]